MDQHLSIVLLGNTGVGKSASANTILGRKAFKSQQSFQPVTKQCSAEAGNVCGRQISVIDTPGILCAGAEEQIKTYCQNILRSSRSHLFLVVIKIDRFTDEQKKAVEAAVRVLGNQGVKKSYMLFTFGDALEDMLLEEFTNNNDGSSLPNFVSRFEGRHHLFNNKDGGQDQVKELLTKLGHLRTQQQATVINEEQQKQTDQSGRGQTKKPRKAAWRRAWPFVKRQWRKLSRRLREHFPQRKNRPSDVERELFNLPAKFSSHPTQVAARVISRDSGQMKSDSSCTESFFVTLHPSCKLLMLRLIHTVVHPS